MSAYSPAPASIKRPVTPPSGSVEVLTRLGQRPWIGTCWPLSGDPQESALIDGNRDIVFVDCDVVEADCAEALLHDLGRLVGPG